MTNGTVNKALLSFAVFAAILVATGIISALIAQSAAAENTSSTIKTTQSHICHYKAKDSPILHSCNDVVRGSVSHPGESK
jgi:hypothetical protein